MAKAALNLPKVELFLYLRSASVDQDNPHTHCRQKRDIVGQAFELTCFYKLPRKTNDKGFVTEGMNVGCYGSQPRYEIN